MPQRHIQSMREKAGILDYLLYILAGGVFTTIGVSFFLWLRF